MNVSKAVARYARIALVSVVVFGICGALALSATPELLKQPDTEGAQEVYEEKPTTSIVGEFRTSLSSFLYARAHDYMHGGMVFRAATEAEVSAGKRLATHGDSLEDHHGTQETSVVPEQSYDPRSFWGDIERNTQPWMDIRHHGHRDLVESLPLFRIMTWADPHFIEGYDMGSYLVFSAAKDRNVDRAMEFLAEGIKNNPNSYRLLKSYGHYVLTQKHDARTAASYLQRAVEILELRAKRPPAREQTERQKMIDDMESMQAWNEFIQALRKSGRKEETIRWAKRCLEVSPCASGKRALEIYGIPVPKRGAHGSD
jgi:tetratricopeptide (TPR) repeat protein